MQVRYVRHSRWKIQKFLSDGLFCFSVGRISYSWFYEFNNNTIRHNTFINTLSKSMSAWVGHAHARIGNEAWASLTSVKNLFWAHVMLRAYTPKSILTRAHVFLNTCAKWISVCAQDIAFILITHLNCFDQFILMNKFLLDFLIFWSYFVIFP